jgi:hypothetical protein
MQAKKETLKRTLTSSPPTEANYEERAPDSAVFASNITRLAYTKAETAEALGVSISIAFVDDHVWPELKPVHWGRKTLAPVREIEALLERKAARVLDRPQASRFCA